MILTPEQLHAAGRELAELVARPQNHRAADAESGTSVVMPTNLALANKTIAKMQRIGHPVAADTIARIIGDHARESFPELAATPRPEGDATMTVEQRVSKDPTASTLEVDGSLTVRDADGNERLLTYNPDDPSHKPPLWKLVLQALRNAKDKREKLKKFRQRAKDILANVTDEELMWSLGRIPKLVRQEGILREDNNALVNQWPQGAAIHEVKPEDFASSSLDEQSLIRVFLMAMEPELPADRSGWTAAGDLHEALPAVAHFMGSTLQERVLAVALRGRAPERSVWIREEMRHAETLAKIRNNSRSPGRPAITAQGIAPREPKPTTYSARSMMANRALAELAASFAYLTLRANATEGSATD